MRRLRGTQLAIPSIAIAALLLALLVAALPARGQQNGSAEIEAAVANLVATFNAGDPEAFADLFTDEGLIAFVEEPSATREEAIEIVGEFMGFATVEVVEVRDVEVTNGSASAIAELDLGGFISIDLIEFTNIDGAWIVSNYVTGVEQPPLPEVPSGYKTIDVDMLEYAFVFDAGQIQVGDRVAFEAVNVGEEPHEFILVKVPADFDLEAALESDEEPEGIEDIAFAFANPGQTGIAIAAEPLDEGRYVVICFVSTDGVPHALLGMVTEFTLVSPPAATPTAAATPRPPATGAGPAGDGGSSVGYLVLGLAIVVVGFGGAMATRLATRRQGS